MAPDERTRFATSLESELHTNILPYWPRLRTSDSFISSLDSENHLIPGTPLGLIMVSRLLWTYSRAYHLFGRAEHKALAEHAKQVLTTQFADNEHGGYYWSTGEGGQALETKKQSYGQAFCIYAFSEHFHATADPDSLDRARALYRLLEEKAWDRASEGYLETFEANWEPLEKMQLSEVDIEAPKTMNNHLHIIEAYANLHRVAPTPETEKSCRRVLRTISDRILLPDTPRFGLFYGMDWKLLDRVVSPGHDIEGSWLLHEAAEIIGDPELIAEFKKLAIDMAKLVLETGVDPKDGGIYDEFHEGSSKADTKCWWPQAEGVVGFYNAYQLSGDTRYLDASLNLWDYIQTTIVDKQNGEWLWGVHSDGTRMEKEKAGPWKSSYHNGRACFEMLARLEQQSPTLPD